MGKTQRPTRATPAKPRARRTKRIEAPRPRLDLSFRTDAPKCNTLRFAFLLELAKASGLSVAEARQGLDGIRDTLLENLKANKYSRIPEMLRFRGVMQRPTKASTAVLQGEARKFNARVVLKKMVRGTALKPLREAFSSAT